MPHSKHATRSVLRRKGRSATPSKRRSTCSIAAKRATALGNPPVFTDHGVMLKETRPDFVVALGRHRDMAATAHHLLDAGVPFVMTKTGQEAWNVLQRAQKKAQDDGTDIADQIALVLTDLEMPEMDGFTLTRRIKADDRPDTTLRDIAESMPALGGKQLWIPPRPGGRAGRWAKLLMSGGPVTIYSPWHRSRSAGHRFDGA